MSVTLTDTRTQAIIDFLDEENAFRPGVGAFGYLTALPSPEVVNAFKKLDYSATIILGKNSHGENANESYREVTLPGDDATDEQKELAELYDGDGIATVGGYAIDTMNRHRYAEFKRAFSMFIAPYGADITFSNDFLVLAKVDDSGIYPFASMRFEFKSDNFGVRAVADKNTGIGSGYLDLFEQGLHAIAHRQPLNKSVR